MCPLVYLYGSFDGMFALVNNIFIGQINSFPL